MIDAYENSAKRLMDASTEDRAWVLAQLSPEDRIRIVASFRDLVERSDENHSETERVIPDLDLRQAASMQESYPALGSADVASIVNILSNEPDWIVAMLVRDARWSWVEGFLEAVEPARLGRIECWVRIGRETIRPAVIEHLLKQVNQKLERTEGILSAPSAFEDILVRLRKKAVNYVHSKAQAPE